MTEKAGKIKNKDKNKGNTFYEAVPATRTVSGELHLPKIKPSTADFFESIIIFFAGTIEVLLFLRILLMTFEVGGNNNLLTYLLYAVSYPFVAVINSSQGQIPEITSAILYENLTLMAVYFVIFYAFLKIVRALKAEEH